MDESEQIMTRYLLGELSESEQRALEEKYFTDPQVFDQVLKTESELVDNYVRGRLSPQARERFEQSYLAHPRRRERVKFAEALVTRLDQIEVSRTAAMQPVRAESPWQRLGERLRGQRLTWQFSMALASLLIAVGSVWFFIENRRLRQEMAHIQAARADQARRERELQQQLTDERMRAHELAAEQGRAVELATELERLRTQPQRIQTQPAPPVRAAPAFVSLLLTVGGVRSTGIEPPATLVIPRGTEQVRLHLNLKESEYPNYSVVLQAVGGAEVLSREGVRPKTTTSGATFVLIVPARKFATGDYLLTLRGVNHDGEIDELSKSIFRVEKR